jgi:hypothetical protein
MRSFILYALSLLECLKEEEEGGRCNTCGRPEKCIEISGLKT